ncbi:sodium:proton antiporter [Coraliomargarita sinensis]|uniref:Sodium:proton antiporter n=1 Tax=Coraliomargarita sinensis TaxID=2174842 RepID=A0A317ZGL4_9BACT|nr:Na+/H+ antiporter subunit E [Coraliomargarita sinensis]PXA04745.1 sodium:proton antiporter [Coraliomargarita sinensis]
MSRIFATIAFLLFYIKEVVKSNFRVAQDVLTPEFGMEPGVIAVNVEGMTDRQLLFMANLITMTPGTLGLYVSEDHTRLYIHTMYADGQIDAMVTELENDYGRRVRRVF